MTFFKNHKYYLLIAITIMVIVVISVIDGIIKSDVCSGIVDFELAKHYDRSQQILNAWTAKQRMWVAFDLGFDYLFILLYVLLITSSIYKIISKLPASQSLIIKMGKVLIVAIIIAGIFDAIENYLLFKILLGNKQTTVPYFAYIFASAKFILIGLGIAYLIIISLKYRHVIFGKKAVVSE